MEGIEDRLNRIEEMLAVLVERQTIKDYYEMEEFSRLVGKAAFTVREWARLGRIRAEKRRSGRGAFASWVVSHAELLRYQKEGLLPAPTANGQSGRQQIAIK
jgi:predicted site-specific integrase-resolvase